MLDNIRKAKGRDLSAFSFSAVRFPQCDAAKETTIGRIRLAAAISRMVNLVPELLSLPRHICNETFGVSADRGQWTDKAIKQTNI